MPRGKQLSVLIRENNRGKRRQHPYSLPNQTYKNCKEITKSYDSIKQQLLKTMENKLQEVLSIIQQVWTNGMKLCMPYIKYVNHETCTSVETNNDDEYKFLDVFFDDAFKNTPLSDSALTNDVIDDIIKEMQDIEEKDKDTCEEQKCENIQKQTNQRPSRLRRKPERFIAV